MSVVSVDTQILSFAIVGQAANVEERLIIRANHLLKKLDEDKHRIIIPTIAVGELLTAIPEDDQRQVIQRFATDWRLVDYNIRAASIFANMRRDWRTKNKLKNVRDYDNSATKTELVADVMIIACAIAHNADLIYSHNENFRKMAEGFIPAVDLPDDDHQLELIKDGY